MYKIKQENFLEWYFSETDDLTLSMKSILDELKENRDIIINNEYFLKRTQYIPSHLIEGFNDEDKELEPSKIKIIPTSSEDSIKEKSDEIKRRLYSAGSELDDVREELIEAESNLDDANNEIEEFINQEDNSIRIKDKSLHDVYKIEELQRIFNKYSLEELKKL